MSVERKKIVMTMDEDVYNRIVERAKRMGISQAGFCMYQVTKALAEMELAEEVAIQAVKEHVKNVVSGDE